MSFQKPAHREFWMELMGMAGDDPVAGYYVVNRAAIVEGLIVVNATDLFPPADDDRCPTPPGDDVSLQMADEQLELLSMVARSEYAECGEHVLGNDGDGNELVLIRARGAYLDGAVRFGALAVTATAADGRVADQIALIGMGDHPEMVLRLHLTDPPEGPAAARPLDADVRQMVQAVFDLICQRFEPEDPDDLDDPLPTPLHGRVTGADEDGSPNG